MLKSYNTPAFERDVKKCKKKHWDIEALKEGMAAILHSDETPIPFAYNDHVLVGNKQGKRAIHIGGRSSNWLVLYDISDNIVGFARTGTHDEVFR